MSNNMKIIHVINYRKGRRVKKILQKEFKSIQIDTERNIFKLNGETMEGVSALSLEFENGKWALSVTKDELYIQTAPEKFKV